LSKLQFDFEIIHRINESRDIKKEEILELAKNAPKEIIFDVASNLRDEKKGKRISFSKKAFFDIINLCRDTCSYCTYKAEPNDTKLSLMNKQTVKE
jgi:2-iminoacetate synthase ThiH